MEVIFCNFSHGHQFFFILFLSALASSFFFVTQMPLASFPLKWVISIRRL